MAFVDYFPTTAAVDPTTGVRLTNVDAVVYDIADTSFATPLNLTDPTTGVSMGTTLTASDDGFFPDFQAPGHTQVIAVSGVYRTPLTSLYGLVLSLLPDPSGEDDGLRVVTQSGEYVLTDTIDSGVPDPATGSPGEALVVAEDGTLTYSPIAAGGTPDWDAVLNKPATFPASTHTHLAAEISNSSNLGRAVLSAADAPSMRVLIQAAPNTTVSFPGFGTTASTAAPGNHSHPASTMPFTPTGALNSTNVQAAIEEAATLGGAGGVADWDTLVDKPATFTPSPHTHAATEISNASLVGRSVLTAFDAQTARAAIGAGTGNGTSNLALGTTATTAAAGNHNHSATALTFTPNTSLGLTATNIQTAIEQAAQTGSGGTTVTSNTRYIKYASGAYPALPTVKPTGVDKFIFEGPVQPTTGNVSGGIPTYIGDGATQIMADYNYRNLT